MIKWNNNFWLFTPEEFEKIPDKTELISIHNERVTKGIDNIDLDTRFGHIAYGVTDPWNHPLKHLFLMFALSS